MDEGLVTSLTLIVSFVAWLVARYFYIVRKLRTDLDRERLQLDAQERLAMIHLEETKAQAQVEIARCQSAARLPLSHAEQHPAGRLN